MPVLFQYRCANVSALLGQGWVRRHDVAIRGVAGARASEDAFDAMITAAALLRCALERGPVADLSLGEPEIEGAILCTGTVDPSLRAERFRPAKARRPARPRYRRA